MNLFFKNLMTQPTVTIGLTVLITALVVSCAIYLTPLKHLNIIEPTIDDIPATDFQELHTQNKDGYLFIDVRSPQAYADGHAEGSINIPLHEFYNQRTFFPKKGKEIILICSGGVASGVAYSYLEHYGFFNMKRIEGGIESWRASELPMVYKSE
jgi:rhodanese-related sulfurtransferase